MSLEAAAFVAVALIGLVALFQVGLAAGAPWGKAAWGGRNEGTLPKRLRIASGFSVLFLFLAAWVILATAGLVATSPVPVSWLPPITWALAAYFALGAVMNLISPSRVERLWAPISLIIAVSAGIVAAG